MKVLGKLSCFVCDGKGRDYSWRDRDPIEGFKMATMHECLFCEGLGYLNTFRKDYKACQAYVYTLNEELDREEEIRREKERKIKEARDNAKKKLTPEELDLLGIE